MTGGTIDSHWDGKQDTAVTNEHSGIPAFFQSLILYADVAFKEVCMKDSRQLTREDVETVKESIVNASQQKIIVTHGTYTMPDTAKYVAAQCEGLQKTVIFTGSMVPLHGFESSDAPFNLGYAIGVIEHLKPGIYLCMNGRTFSPDSVAKNLHDGNFFSVFDKKQ